MSVPTFVSQKLFVCFHSGAKRAFSIGLALFDQRLLLHRCEY